MFASAIHQQTAGLTDVQRQQRPKSGQERPPPRGHPRGRRQASERGSLLPASAVCASAARTAHTAVLGRWRFEAFGAKVLLCSDFARNALTASAGLETARVLGEPT